MGHGRLSSFPQENKGLIPNTGSLVPSSAVGCEARAPSPAGFLGQQQEKMGREWEQSGAAG